MLLVQPGDLNKIAPGCCPDLTGLSAAARLSGEIKINRIKTRPRREWLSGTPRLARASSEMLTAVKLKDATLTWLDGDKDAKKGRRSGAGGQAACIRHGSLRAGVRPRGAVSDLEGTSGCSPITLDGVAAAVTAAAGRPRSPAPNSRDTSVVGGGGGLPGAALGLVCQAAAADSLKHNTHLCSPSSRAEMMTRGHKFTLLWHHNL